MLTLLVIVLCTGDCVHGSARLVDGGNSNEGRLELCLYTNWGNVYSSSFDGREARVVCRMLGFADWTSKSNKNKHFVVTNKKFSK